MFTYKCASRHNSVHFLDISTSKSGPNALALGKVQNPLRLPHKTTLQGPKMVRGCGVHFDLDMCFTPQQHTLFQHLNFRKGSKAGVFSACSLQNVLCATTACTFSTSQLPNVLWTCGIFTSKSASRHNGMQFFISHLARWLRTRRFSEPNYFSTLRNPEPQNIGKNSVS